VQREVASTLHINTECEDEVAGQHGAQRVGLATGLQGCALNLVAVVFVGPAFVQVHKGLQLGRIVFGIQKLLRTFGPAVA
jgi:hypothetical protein